MRRTLERLISRGRVDLHPKHELSFVVVDLGSCRSPRPNKAWVRKLMVLAEPANCHLLAVSGKQSIIIASLVACFM